jgi:hypothetical protein
MDAGGRLVARTRYASIGALALLLVAAQSASAITFQFWSGNRAAEAVFTQSGSNLIVQLTSTSTFDVTKQSELLTAVFFDLAGNTKLTPVSAVLAPGSVVYFDSAPAGGVVGGEWAYNTWSGNKAPGQARQGISSTGLDLFGPKDRFPGPDLDSPANVGGLNYGLTSAGDNLTTGNSSVTSKEPLIRNSVVFTLQGLGAGFNAATDIYNVHFQYGTSLCEPHYPGIVPPEPLIAGSVPEPLTVVGLTVGLAGLGRYLRRRK